MDIKKFLNIVLLKKDFYRKLTDKKLSLCIGIILVGIIDLGISIVEKFKTFFIGKQDAVLYYNISLVVLFVILIGLIDVIFFSLPLFDLFKLFRKEVEIQNNSSLVVKLMKIEIIASMLVFIPNVLLYLADRSIDYEKYPLAAQVAVIIFILINIWYWAAISRGINSIYSFEPMFKMLVFVVVPFWAFLLNISIGYAVDKYMMILFK